jgi:hypothetical protein
MDFKTYVANAEKQYKVRLKTVVPLDDAAMDAIELAVYKYQPVELSSPKKTIIQANPVDFPNIPAAEVYIVDMTFAMPVSPWILRNDIHRAISAPETFVVIRSDNDALEIEGERVNAARELEIERKKKGWKDSALLSTGKDYPEYTETPADELYGDAYNGAFMDYLAKVRQEREDAQIKAENAPFVWLDIPDRESQEPVQDSTNFNKDIKGVKPGKKIDSRNIMGNVNDRLTVTKMYKDDKGNRKIASVKMGDK